MGKKRNQLAEAEMPGLMAIRRIWPNQPLSENCWLSYMTIQTILIETLVAWC
jgi:S-adenosylhomocysteine hydrolase